MFLLFRHRGGAILGMFFFGYPALGLSIHSLALGIDVGFFLGLRGLFPYFVALEEPLHPFYPAFTVSSPFLIAASLHSWDLFSVLRGIRWTFREKDRFSPLFLLCTTLIEFPALSSH